MMNMWMGYDNPSKDIVQLYKIFYIASVIPVIYHTHWDMTWWWLGYTDLILLYQAYTVYTVCILFRMRCAEDILKLKNLHMFYINFILPALLNLLDMYLRFDNIGDTRGMTSSGMTTSGILRAQADPAPVGPLASRSPPRRRPHPMQGGKGRVRARCSGKKSWCAWWTLCSGMQNLNHNAVSCWISFVVLNRTTWQTYAMDRTSIGMVYDMKRYIPNAIFESRISQVYLNTYFLKKGYDMDMT